VVKRYAGLTRTDADLSGNGFTHLWRPWRNPFRTTGTESLFLLGFGPLMDRISNPTSIIASMHGDATVLSLSVAEAHSTSGQTISPLPRPFSLLQVLRRLTAFANEALLYL
jgi:hypothetical protein